VLPPSMSISDPQVALIAALASPRGSPSQPPKGAAALQQQAPPSQGDLLMMAKAKHQATKQGAGAPTAGSIPLGPPCDRCDGPHKTAECPHFKGGRDNHEDATIGIGKGGPEAEDAAPVIVRARVVSQPGDGSWCALPTRACSPAGRACLACSGHGDRTPALRAAPLPACALGTSSPSPERRRHPDRHPNRCRSAALPARLSAPRLSAPRLSAPRLSSA
jgi:hypothetical protein